MASTTAHGVAPTWTPTRRLVEAVDDACTLHGRQARKHARIPTVAHLFGVCSLVMGAGGDEDVAIAALLHDAVEDAGGDATERRIERRFGRRVATSSPSAPSRTPTRSRRGSSARRPTSRTCSRPRRTPCSSRSPTSSRTRATC
jgi:HD domain